MDKILVACMDRRLNALVDTHNDGKTKILRNGGGDVSSLESSIRNGINENNINRILVLTHTDCGAMKVVYMALKGETKVSGSISERVNPFRDLSHKDKAELEKINEKLQNDRLKVFEKLGIKIESELVDVTKLNIPEVDHDQNSLVVMRSSSKKYDEITMLLRKPMFGTYFIQSDTIQEVIPDIEMAVTHLGIKSISFLSTNSSEARQALTDFKMLKIEPFITHEVRISTDRI